MGLGVHVINTMIQKENTTDELTVEEKREKYNDTEITYDNYTDNVYFEDEFRGNDEDCVFRMVFGEKENNNLADLRTYVHIYEGLDGDKITYIDAGGYCDWIATPDFEHESDLLDCFEGILMDELDFHMDEYDSVEDVIEVLIDDLGREDDVMDFARTIVN